MKRTLASLGALGALLFGGVAAAALAGKSISLTATGPVPPSATLLTGEVLTFQNADTGTVTVSSKGGGLKETAIPPGGTLTTAFTAPGNFRFRAAGRVVYQGNLSVVVAGGGSGLTLAPTKATVRYGTGVSLQGRVPIPGQLVRVQSHLRGQTAWKDLATRAAHERDGRLVPVHAAEAGGEHGLPRPDRRREVHLSAAAGRGPARRLPCRRRRSAPGPGRKVTLRFRMVPYLAAPNATLELLKPERGDRRVLLHRVRRVAGTKIGIVTFSVAIAKGTNRFRATPDGPLRRRLLRPPPDGVREGRRRRRSRRRSRSPRRRTGRASALGGGVRPVAQQRDRTLASRAAARRTSSAWPRSTSCCPTGRPRRPRQACRAARGTRPAPPRVARRLAAERVDHGARAEEVLERGRSEPSGQRSPAATTRTRSPRPAAVARARRRSAARRPGRAGRPGHERRDGRAVRRREEDPLAGLEAQEGRRREARPAGAVTALDGQDGAHARGLLGGALAAERPRHDGRAALDGDRDGGREREDVDDHDDVGPGDGRRRADGAPREVRGRGHRTGRPRCSRARGGAP